MMRRCACGGLALWAALGCADRLAGGSSGVDNPEIAVAFTGPGGSPLPVTGSLGLYRADQNPAVNPQPLAEIQLLNAMSAIVRAESNAVLTLRPFAKASAGAADTVETYNLLLRNGVDSGSIRMRLVYDDTAKQFFLEGDGDSAHTTLPLSVDRFVRCSGRLHQDSVGPGPDRVFIPGTPFQAVVVDSTFTFPALPEGVYPLKLFTASGWEYVVRGSLNTAVQDGIFTIDTTEAPRRPDGIDPGGSLTAQAGPDHGAFLEAETFLSGDIADADAEDPRVAVLWRQISGPATAAIEDPTALRTPVGFSAEGAYMFALSVSFGLGKAADTVLIGVRSANAGAAAFIEPTAGDTLRLGQAFSVIWQGRTEETLSLDLSLDSGATWSPIDTALASTTGLGIFPWTPATGLGTADNCRLRLLAQDSSTAALSAIFLLR